MLYFSISDSIENVYCIDIIYKVILSLRQEAHLGIFDMVGGVQIV